jgi:hypothetical protein
MTMTMGQRRVSEYVKDASESREAITLAVMDLMAAIGRNPVLKTAELVSELLSDLTDTELISGLGKALDTATGWLTPAQLREMCVGTSASAMDAQDADDAYAFVTVYVKDHGVSGRPKWGGMTDRKDAIGRTICNPDIQAPPIGPVTSRALVIVGGSLMGGLSRFNETSTEQLPFLRKDFIAAYLRVVKA